MIIALHGACFTDNFGDELLYEIYCKWIRDEFPEALIAIPFLFFRTRHVYKPDLTGPDTIRRSAALIYYGGGYFGEPRPNNMRWNIRNLCLHAMPAILAYFFRTAYSIIGVGAGPLSNLLVRKVFVEVFRHSKITCVRDYESRRFMTEYGVPTSSLAVTADSALWIRSCHVPAAVHQDVASHLPRERCGPWIGIHLSVDAASKEAATLKAGLTEALRVNRSGMVFVLSDTHVGDMKTNSITLGEVICRDAGVPYMICPFRGPWELAALLSQLDGVMTTKLHVGIVTCAMDQRVLSFAQHQKTPRFYAQINQSDDCHPLQALTSGQIIHIASRWISDIHTKRQIPEAIRAKAEENRRALLQFIARCIGS
jgi:polysaccharide pyruvyl transferase WcaK-like protein